MSHVLHAISRALVISSLGFLVFGIIIARRIMLTIVTLKEALCHDCILLACESQGKACLDAIEGWGEWSTLAVRVYNLSHAGYCLSAVSVLLAVSHAAVGEIWVHALNNSSTNYWPAADWWSFLAQPLHWDWSFKLLSHLLLRWAQNVHVDLYSRSPRGQ